MSGTAPLRPGDLLVLGYAVVAQVELHVWLPSAPVLPRSLLLAAVLVLLGRDRWPRLVPLVSAFGGTAAVSLSGAPGTGIAIVLAAIAAGLLGRLGRAGAPALALLIAPSAVLPAVSGEQRSDAVTGPLILLAIAAVCAVLSRVGRELAVTRERIAQVQEAGRHERAALLTQERRRVARELHDVVSHHLTVAVLHAGGARMRMQSGGDPDAVVAALRESERAGRAALADLRPLLDVVGGGDALTPQPGPAEVPALFEQVRQAGRELTVRGLDPAALDLPVGHGLVVYRVLQEALTNAVRHGRSTVDVRLTAPDGELVVEVANDVGPAGEVVPGHGLVGMAERLELYGGRLDAGRHGHRWVARARLPLPVLETAVPA